MHVEGEAVVREIVAHLVCGTPTHVLAQVGADDLYALAYDANGEEYHACPNKVVHRPIGLCGVDEVAHNLRIEQIETDAREHENAECGDAFPVGAEILR